MDYFNMHSYAALLVRFRNESIAAKFHHLKNSLPLKIPFPFLRQYT